MGEALGSLPAFLVLSHFSRVDCDPMDCGPDAGAPALANNELICAHRALMLSLSLAQVAPSQTLGSQGTGPGSALDPRSAGGPHKVCGSLCSNEMAMAAKITVRVCVSHLSGTRAKQCVTWTSVHDCTMRDKTHRQEHNTLWLC